MAQQNVVKKITGLKVKIDNEARKSEKVAAFRQVYNECKTEFNKNNDNMLLLNDRDQYQHRTYFARDYYVNQEELFAAANEAITTIEERARKKLEHQIEIIESEEPEISEGVDYNFIKLDKEGNASIDPNAISAAMNDTIKKKLKDFVQKSMDNSVDQQEVDELTNDLMSFNIEDQHLSKKEEGHGSEPDNPRKKREGPKNKNKKDKDWIESTDESSEDDSDPNGSESESSDDSKEKKRKKTGKKSPSPPPSDDDGDSDQSTDDNSEKGGSEEDRDDEDDDDEQEKKKQRETKHKKNKKRKEKFFRRFIFGIII